MELPEPVASRRREIEALCRRHGVCRLEVFGSAADGTFDPRSSDIDFLVEFGTLAPGTRADAYFGLLEDLERLLGRHVDLVMTRAVRNPYFLERIESSRVVLYAA